jgi:two-component system alkaline phosphatase synthesis response regulator PhoP
MVAAKKRILMIDDDKDFVLSTKTFLEGRGYEMDTAHNGTDGWEKIQKGQADLIVLDIMMDTDTEGFNLAYKMKEMEATRRIPIVIVSGFPQHLDEKFEKFEFILGREWPAVAQMEKPIELKELAKIIDRFVPAQ